MAEPLDGNNTYGVHTRREILSQGESWQAAIDAVKTAEHVAAAFNSDPNRTVLFTGCGSPFFICLTAAAVFQAQTGRLAIALPSSEVLFNYSAYVPAGPPPLVVAISRSGETSELLAACRRLKDDGSPVLAINVGGPSSLTRLADIPIQLEHAEELSLAQTRSFSAMLIATLMAIASAAGPSSLVRTMAALPLQAASYLAQTQAALDGLRPRPYRRVEFLGSGPRFGLACEGAMKMTEMSLTDCAAFHFLEFRHGPQAMIDADSLVVGMLSHAGHDAEYAVLDDVLALGATVLAIAPGDLQSRRDRFVPIHIDDNLPMAAALLLCMPPLQMLAYRQALQKGIDPDQPRNLTKYVDLSFAKLAGSDGEITSPNTERKLTHEGGNT